MSVKITSNIPSIKSGNEANTSLALRFMLEAIDSEAYYKTPKDKGNLRNDLIKRVMGKNAVIIWNKEYAKFQEDKKHRKYTTAGTGPHFAENAVRKVMENADQYFRKAGAI